MKLKNYCSFLFCVSSICLASDLTLVDENEAMSVIATKTGQALILELQPKRGALIPLDPGIKVVCEDESSVWQQVLPSTFLKSERYMHTSERISLRVPDDKASVDLKVVHAYCPTEDICQFLDLDIHIP